MNLLDLVAVLLVTAGAIAFVNYRLVKLPPAVAMLAGGMVGAVAILAADRVWPNAGLDAAIARLLADVDFSTLLMNGMLGFLLFAGALTVDIAHLREQLGPVLTLATVGVLLSTAIVETGARLLFAIAGVPVPFAWCLVFGALISPTDPVAVLAIMETLRVPKSLEINVTGESLLNDGVGVVVFTVLLALASAPGSVSPTAVALLFAREVVGGVLLGAAGGVVAYQAMKRVDEPNVEVQLSVALVIALIARSRLGSARLRDRRNHHRQRSAPSRDARPDARGARPRLVVRRSSPSVCHWPSCAAVASCPAGSSAC